jgi:hypothetical protein
MANITLKNKQRGNKMSHLKSVRRYIETNHLNEHTISLCVAGPEVEYNAEYLDQDTSYGRCDITGTHGIVHWCAALNNNGETVHFQALDSLVGGALGRIAGAF